MLFTPRPKGLGKENFLKLSDGEEVTGVFRGQPHTFRRHWMQSTQRSSECVGEGCPICQADPENRPAFRFRINFITTRDGRWIPKIFEGGGELYDQLSSLDKKLNLANTVVEIQRRGVKQNTKYMIIPMTNMPITKEMAAMIAQVQLLPLSHDDEEEAAPKPKVTEQRPASRVHGVE